MTKILLDNDWKTGYAPCDDAIGLAVIECVQKKITIRTFFQKLRDFKVDFYPEAEITGETFQKVLDTLKNAGIASKKVQEAFVHVQSRSLFEQILDENPSAEIKFNAVEEQLEGEKIIWPYEDTLDELKVKLAQYIQDYDGVYFIRLFKVAVIKKDPDDEKYTLLLEDLQGKLRMF